MKHRSRLAALRASADMTQEHAAEAMGLSLGGYRKLEYGERRLKLEQIQKAADVFGVSFGEVAADGETPASLLDVPVVSWVSATSLVTPDAPIDDEDALKISTADLDPEGDWIALRVVGSSMDRISPPDSVILVNRKDKRLVPNACYVIATEDEGEASYKRYRPGPDRWEPVSTLDHDTLYPPPGGGPKIVGRVRRTILDL